MRPCGCQTLDRVPERPQFCAEKVQSHLEPEGLPVGNTPGFLNREQRFINEGSIIHGLTNRQRIALGTERVQSGQGTVSFDHVFEKIGRAVQSESTVARLGAGWRGYFSDRRGVDSEMRGGGWSRVLRTERLSASAQSGDLGYAVTGQENAPPAMAADVTSHVWDVQDLVALWGAYERGGGESGVNDHCRVGSELPETVRTLCLLQ
jgi:hypothetical protein